MDQIYKKKPGAAIPGFLCEAYHLDQMYLATWHQAGTDIHMISEYGHPGYGLILNG